MEEMEINECIQNCIDTHAICLSTSEKKVGMEIAKSLQDCSQICQTAADFMIRKSKMHVKTCEACADVCEDLAMQCKKTNDDTLNEIAELSVKCAESCRMMARMGAEGLREPSRSKGKAAI